MTNAEFKLAKQQEVDATNLDMWRKIAHTLIKKAGGHVVIHIRDLARLELRESLEIEPLDEKTFTRIIRAK